MNAFEKEERLCSKKSLDLLFKTGSSFLFYPFRLTFLQTAEASKFPAQVVINVAKKRYKLAVHRNLVKRRTREAYRLQKQELFYQYLKKDTGLLLLSVQYIGKEIHDYSLFEKKLGACLTKLVAKLLPNESN